MQESEVPGNAGRRPLYEGHVGGAVLNFAMLALVPTGIALAPFLSIMIESADV